MVLCMMDLRAHPFALEISMYEGHCCAGDHQYVLSLKLASIYDMYVCDTG